MSPTEEMYRSKTNAELKELLEVFELGTPKAKNPFKPNKDEVVQALKEYKRSQDRINGIEPEEGDEIPVEDEDDVSTEEEYRTPITNRPMNKSSKIALLRADLFRKECVIVHDTQTQQTGFPLITVTWGNKLIGHQTDIVYFGKPWYVRRGALKNLEGVMITEHMQEPGGQITTETRPRFLITEQSGWTEEELKLKATDQALLS